MNNPTRQKLLDSAIEMFWLQSYSCVSVEDICQKAGVKKGSFYHFFPSKSDLVLEAFEQLWERFSVILDDAFSKERSPRERLHCYAELAYRVQKEKAEQTGKVLGCPYASCGGEMGTQDERIRLKIVALLDRYSLYFKGVLDDAGIDTKTASCYTEMQMLSYSTGVIFQAKIRNDVEIIRRDLEVGLLRFLSYEPVHERS